MKNRDIMGLVENWTPPIRPKGQALAGQYAKLEALNANAHARDIFAANSHSDGIWDYLPYGPYPELSGYADWVKKFEGSDDPTFYAIYDCERGHWAGVASYLRVTPDAGSIEVGHINFSPALQRTRAATEAMYLMMKWAFQAGYRRYEWKCDAANMGSRRAAERFGLSYEGIFRQAAVVKGRNRDTAWFAAIDSEWPALDTAYTKWLSPDNFDAQGQQITSLSALTGPVLVARDT